MIDFSIRNPLLVNLSLMLVTLVGLLSWAAMPQEMFPTVQEDKVQIITLYEGAAPEEVERQVTLPLEEELDGLADVDVMTSTSSEGISKILIKLKSGADVDDFLRDAQNAVDKVIPDIPKEVDEPTMTRLESRFPVISMSLYGDVSRDYLNQLADDTRRELAQLKDVASVGIAGDREWELWVVVDPAKLAAYHVSLEQVARALRSNLRDLPGGSLRTSEGDIRLRGIGAAPQQQAMAKIAIRSNDEGGLLRLGDIADSELQFAESVTLGRFMGKPSINLTINKTSGGSTIEVARMVREYADALQQRLPAGVGSGFFSDFSVYVKTRLNTVTSSGIVGLTLVLLSLYLLLNFRVAGITALGIPLSFLTAVIFIHYAGYSINMVSLFAFLVALGIVVDDAIIVTENIYRHVEEGMEPHHAASQGAKEVFWPVVASTATTIAAFMPIFGITGTMGTFISVIPAVVIASLAGSLIEAFGILPSHAAEWLRPASAHKDHRAMWKRMSRNYLKLLRTALHYRYHTALITIGILAIVVTIAVTRIPFLLFGHVDVGQFFINVEAPVTYTLDESSELAQQMEQMLFDQLEEDELSTVLTNIGVTFIDFNRVKFGYNQIQLIVDLKKRKPKGFIENYVSPIVSLKFNREGSRERPTDEIINDIRERMLKIPGISKLSILRPSGGPEGKDIEVGIAGEQVGVLQQQAQLVTAFLHKIPGVHDVQHDMEPGKLEYRYQLNEHGRQLGLSQENLANALRTGFLGLEVTQVNWRNKRIPVRLIYPQSIRHSNFQLEQLPITLDDGRTIYLGDVAKIEKSRGFDSIRRRDMERLATITADVDANIITPDEVVNKIDAAFGDIQERFPGYRLLYLGSKKEANESIAGMKRAGVIALFVIFFILAALFKSLLDPFVVMISIPFGLIGVIIGHLLFGIHIQFLSMIGFLALSGIVVNDSLILVDFARKLRNRGMNRMDAMVEAGRMRIRPIMLTTITTFLGISPLIFFATGQTAFLAPMAISLGFGLLFATGLILVALPSFYMIADDMRQFSSGIFHKLFATEKSNA